MARALDYIEWNRVKDQLDQRRDRLEQRLRDDKLRDGDISQLFDAEIRYRFGELISRAARSSRTRRH